MTQAAGAAEAFFPLKNLALIPPTEAGAGPFGNFE